MKTYILNITFYILTLLLWNVTGVKSQDDIKASVSAMIPEVITEHRSLAYTSIAVLAKNNTILSHMFPQSC